MTVGTGLRTAWRALRSNKIRSSLTMLGVIIGVGAVILMIAIGNGAKAKISQQIASIGSNLFMVLPGSTTSGGLRMGSGTNPTLTIDDALSISRECPAVKAAAPIQSGTAQVVYGNRNWSTIVTGTLPPYQEVREWSLARGRFLTQQDVDGAGKVCVIGQTIVQELFGSIDPLDKSIRIRRVPFRVIGILAPKGQSPTGQDQDDTIIIPVTTALNRLFGQTLPRVVRIIMVKAQGAEAMEAAESQMKALLQQRHRIAPGQEEDFSIRNLSEMMEAAEQSTRVMSLLLGAIASISLLVGGIGIMNIMLVSVTERTREIGIRMAVGAKEGEILMQFLIEAVLLSLGGGAIGLLLGVAAARTISTLLSWPILISPGAIVLAFSFSASVGLFFGLYPARRASLLDPIEALRHE